MAIMIRHLNKNKLYVFKNTMNDCNTGLHLFYCRNVVGRAWSNTVVSSSTFLRYGFRLQNVQYSPLDNAPFKLDHNVVKVRGDGFWLRNSDHVNVEQNTVQMIALASAPGSGIGSNAIRLEHTEHCKVYDNDLTSDFGNLAANRTWMRGIWVETGPTTDVSCNRLTNFGWGIAFRSVCLGVSVRYNDIYNGVDGMLLVASGEIGNQGAIGNPMGNRWFGSFTHGQTHSILSKAQFHSYIVSPNTATTTYWPSVNMLTGGLPYTNFLFCHPGKTASAATTAQHHHA